MATKTTLSTAGFSTSWNGSSYDHTQSLTIPAGTSHLCVRFRNSSSAAPTFTFNGVSLTQGPTADDGAAGCFIYYLSSPAIGTFDLYFNSGGAARTVQPVIDAISGSSGVGDTGSVGSFAADKSLTVSTGVDDLVLDALILNSAAITAAAGTGQTSDLINTNQTSASSEVAVGTSTVMSWTHEATASAQVAIVFTNGSVTPSLRKGSQFTVETTLAGTVTSATLNGAAITVDSHVGTTVTLTDSDGSIATSGEYALVLTDNAAATETITVQVNVYGVAPNNNPLQKDGAALASLTNVEVRISAGATLAGSQLFYSGTATTDVSGNLGNIDLSSTAAADADPVLLSIRTAAGDSIIASETVGII